MAYSLLNPNISVDSKYQNQIDSLKSIVNAQNRIYDLKIEVLNNSVDSLIKIKTVVSIKYKDKYENYSNVDIVSNDSITTYISKKIHNR